VNTAIADLPFHCPYQEGICQFLLAAAESVRCQPDFDSRPIKNGLCPLFCQFFVTAGAVYGSYPACLLSIFCINPGRSKDGH
jgi:hypothetical protein